MQWWNDFPKANFTWELTIKELPTICDIDFSRMVNPYVRFKLFKHNKTPIGSGFSSYTKIW